MLIDLILFGGLLLTIYVYAGYPLMLWFWGRIRGLKTHVAAITPFVSVIIAAHNEDATIGDKLENTLALDYPNGRMEILVASDGSTDGTEEIVARYALRGVRLLRLARCGKMKALERLVSFARGEILVFTDANTWLIPQAMRALAAHFADPEVGGVCGCKRIGKTVAGEIVALSEGFYWKYDQLLKVWESRLGSTIAADGALYAIRRELFQPPVDPAQADDLAISARIRMQGKRLIFDTRAVVWEEPPSSAKSEFWRKVRITNHTTRSLWELRAALNPLRTGIFAVSLWSHKLLRYFVAIFLAAAWVANFMLAGSSMFYSTLLAAQNAFYGLALAGGILRCRPLGRNPLLHVPFYFCLAHLAAVFGVLSALFGKRIIVWKHQRKSPGFEVSLNPHGQMRIE